MLPHAPVSERPDWGLFVTGTDTGVGKTVVSAGLMRAFRSRGLRVAGMKPVASGCVPTPDGLRSDDALLLMQEQSIDAGYELVNPYAFEPAIAPHLAAREAGVSIRFGPLYAIFDGLAQQADLVVVEGAGGWCAPLSDEATVEDLALSLGLPVILVVGLRLGCLNHAILTARAIERRSLPLAGWVGNCIVPEFSRWEDNVTTLTRLIPAPRLGIVPYRPQPDIGEVARALDIEHLAERWTARPTD